MTPNELRQGLALKNVVVGRSLSQRKAGFSIEGIGPLVIPYRGHFYCGTAAPGRRFGFMLHKSKSNPVASVFLMDAEMIDGAGASRGTEVDPIVRTGKTGNSSFAYCN
jgi:hypothetical protein